MRLLSATSSANSAVEATSATLTRRMASITGPVTYILMMPADGSEVE
jgi:hypothetical protein